MNVKVLTGSKKEIAETFARIDGEIREVIVFVEEQPESSQQPPDEDSPPKWSRSLLSGGRRIIREMLYTRMEGE